MMLRFEKWQAQGNDFVLIADDSLVSITPTEVRALCDRHVGVGADGVLLVTGLEDLRPRMIIYNADGSRPEMCGNGLRCVAAYVVDRLESLAGGTESERALLIETDAGSRCCVVAAGRPGGHCREVRADMGIARLGDEFQAHGLRFVEVNIGNPHAVTFDAPATSELAVIGSDVERAAPAGRNVEFCRLVEDGLERRIEVVVWERGVGFTQACGTGACAVAAAACARMLVDAGKPVPVVLPGGLMRCTVHPNGLVQLCGQAVRVFGGELGKGSLTVGRLKGPETSRVTGKCDRW